MSFLQHIAQDVVKNITAEPQSKGISAHTDTAHGLGTQDGTVTPPRWPVLTFTARLTKLPSWLGSQGESQQSLFVLLCEFKCLIM